MSRLSVVSRSCLLGLAFLVAAAARSAHADDTILKLSETITIMVAPDELIATLRAEAVSPTAQDAQKRVNDLMRDAIESAKKFTGVTVSTGGYNVWRTGMTPQDRAERWQAGQTINLSGKDAEPMLKLVGDLQQKGFVQSNLGWRLAQDTEHKARQNATKQALANLRGRANDAAEILGLQFASFREVRIDSVAPPPIIPRQQGFSARAAMASAQPPSAEAEELPVTASAEADILLKPR